MALIEKYVSSLAAGGGTGLSAASPLTFTEMVTAINAGTEAGSRFNVLKGTYTRASSDTISGSGSATSPVIIKGYSTTIGDGYLSRAIAHGPLITTNMPTVAYNSSLLLNVTGSYIIIESFIFTGNRSGQVISASQASVVFRACSVTNISTNTAVVGISSTSGIVHNNDVFLTGASGGATGAGISIGGAYAIGNRVTTGATTAPAIAINVSNRAGVVINNILFNSGGVGIFAGNTLTALCAVSNTITGFASDGINIITGNAQTHVILNNIITDNGGYGINLVSAASASFLSNNRTRDNTSGAINLGTDWAAATSYDHVTTDTGNASTDYTNAAGNDYSLIAASPATSAGFPAFASIGALQRSQTSSGATENSRAFAA